MEQRQGSASASNHTRQLRSALNATPVKTSATAVDPPKLRTGLVYDERMLETRHRWLPDHAETPERIKVCYDRAKQLGLVERCVQISPRYATDAEISEVHSDGLIEEMRHSETANESELLKMSEKHGTHFDNAAYKCALLSAGSALNLVDAILSNQVDNGMAIIRPPGHHASHDKANGYCFFNNAALVARRAITKHNRHRVLIVDWDIHHGQGTQRLFYNSHNVLYVSIHRYEYAKFWPYLRESDWDYIGAGQGRGYNINIPLNRTGLGDSEYIQIFQQVILPIARDYNPELVIVSAGYDCALGCPEGQMLVTPACFAHLVHSLRQFAGGKVCVLLEGGYFLKSLAEGAALTLRDLLGDPCPLLPGGAITSADPVLVRTILLLMRVLRPYWPNALNYQGKTSPDDPRWAKWLALACKRRTKARFIDEYRPDFDFWTPEQNTGYQNAAEFAEMEKRVAEVSFVPRPIPQYARLCVVVSDGDAMLKHKAPAHEFAHPEAPERISSIVNRLKETKIINDDPSLVQVIKSRPATRAELLSAHTESHVSDIERLPTMEVNSINEWALDQNSLYACPESLTSALHAAGGLIDAVDMVLSGRAATAFAAIRPPGHHSDSTCAAGFCLFNNVAVAAKVAKEKYKLKRILIVDWDVHFGDGTSSIFIDDPEVLYMSLHRYENGRFYPGKKEGDYDNAGEWRGSGYNVNIPWSGGRMGQSEYIAAFERVIMPIAYEYNPELVFVSAGFDAAAGDPLGGYNVTPEAYGAMTMYLTSLAGGRCVIALEGGYNLTSISDASEACCRSLLGVSPAWSISALERPLQSAVDTITQVLDTQAEFWKCLLPFRVSLPSDSAELLAAPSKGGSVKKGAAAVARNLRQQQTPSPNPISPNVVPPPPMQTPVVQTTSITAPLTEDTLTEAFRRVTISNTTPSVQSNVAAALGLSTTPGGGSDETGFLVDVLPTCQHADASICCRRPSDLPAGLKSDAACDSCGDLIEAWICLACFQVGCGRHRSGHAVEHYEQTGHRHSMSMGLTDMSLWCYACEAYIDPRQAGALYNTLYRVRFGSEPPNATTSVSQQ